MKGTYKDGGAYFGKVVEPFSFCDPIFYVYDKDETIRYRLKIDCCQCGFFFRGSCGVASPIEVNIYGGTDISMTGTPIGTIKKKFTGFQELVSDADTFQITFPTIATPAEKLMLIGAVLMIDFRYYESNNFCNGDDNNRGHHHHRGGPHHMHHHPPHHHH